MKKLKKILLMAMMALLLCANVTTVFADEVTYPVEAVSARVAHICLVDSLAMLLAAHNYDSFADHIKSRNDVLEGIRY